MDEYIVLQGGFLCGECSHGVTFQSMYDVKAHHDVYHNTVRPQRFLCSVCKMASEDEKLMSEHFFDHFPKGRYMCLKCEHPSLKSKLDVTLHLRHAHGVSMRYYCRKCGEAFPSELNVIKHAESRHNASLRIHETVHSLLGRLPPRSVEYMEIQGGFLCRRCTDSVIFQTTLDLLAHHNSQHRTSGKLNVACSECNFKCQDSQQIDEHLRNHFSSGRYKCLQCPSKKFQAEFIVKRHVEHVHGVPMLYSCRACGCAFSSVLNVIKHALSTHSDHLLKFGYGSAENVVQERVVPNAIRLPQTGQSNSMRTHWPRLYRVPSDVDLSTPQNVTKLADASLDNFSQTQGFAMNPVPSDVGLVTPSLSVIKYAGASLSNFSQTHQGCFMKPVPHPLNVTRHAQSSHSNFSQAEGPAMNPVPPFVGQAMPQKVSEEAESSHNKFLRTHAEQEDVGQLTSNMEATAGSTAEPKEKATEDDLKLWRGWK